MATTKQIDISELISRRKEIYLKDPLQIVENFNNENKNVDEYNGRQLLEMIQNANDESDTEKAKKVLIQLTEDNLIIANNGNPFSKGGVESLMYSDLSPKTMEENKVGKKGLGFRSILNWSKEIYISSYDLHLKFSQKYAESFLKELYLQKPSIKEELKEKTPIEYPISVLRCPFIETNHSLRKASDYDTAIELTLKSNVYFEIVNQIEKDIVPEVLIFLNKLDEIEVKTINEHFVLKKSTSSADNELTVSKTDYFDDSKSFTRKWKILSDEGELKGKYETKNYELKIAYNPKQIVDRHKLFSFFRTEVDFPYPLIVHGSFELKSDRNNLVQDKNGFNKILLGKLAKLMVSCAKELTLNEKVGYDALKLVVSKPSGYSSLHGEPWHFDSLLLEEVQQAEIFPTVQNKYISLSEKTRFYTADLENLIPPEGRSNFKNLLKFTDDSSIKEFFRLHKNNLKYQNNTLTTKINKLVSSGLLSMEEKVDWIHLLLTDTSIYGKWNSTLPDLLVSNNNEKVIYFGAEAISPPEIENYKTPKHVNLAFINIRMFNLLKRKFDLGSSRQLIAKLEQYNVSEYSMNVALNKIISEVHKKVDKDQNLAKDLIFEMHEYIFSIYSNIKEGMEAEKEIPRVVTCPYVFSRNGNLKPANTLYFGEDYSGGLLMEGLLNGIKGDFFVGNEDNFSFISTKDSIESYLKWLRVAAFPRKVNKQISSYQSKNNEYITSIIEELDYPYTIPGFSETYSSQKEIEQCTNYTVDVLWYDNIEFIIDNSSFENILAWFILESDLYASLQWNKEYSNASFTFSPANKRYKRSIREADIHSYILYWLKQKDFLPLANGEKGYIKDCLTETVNLSPLVKTPQINYNATIFDKCKISQYQIKGLLSVLGLKESLRELSLNEIYRYLLMHHDAFKEAKKNVQNFYIAVIEATRNKSIDLKKIPNGQKFHQEGKIYAEYNGVKSFYSIQEVTYVDNPNFSQDLQRKLKIAKLPTRSGNTRMKRLFGINPLDYIKFYLDGDVNSNEKINQDFSTELLQLKPAIFTYRFQKGLTKSQVESELSSIKSLHVQTCYDISIYYELNDKHESLKLNDYEFILDEKSGVFFVKIPFEIESYSELKVNYRFKETLADIICGAIKVFENRKDFMLLLGESSANWDKVLQREFDNYKVIEKEILKRFKGTLNSEEKFWRAFFDSLKIEIDSNDLSNREVIHQKLNFSESFDVFYNLTREFNFSDLDADENIPKLLKLFKLSGLNVSDFNQRGYKHINLVPYWDNKLKTINSEFELKRKSYFFKKEDVKNYFFSCENPISIPKAINDIDFDPKAYLKAFYSQTLSPDLLEAIDQTEIVNLSGIYNSNLNELRKKLQSLDGFSETSFNDLSYNKDFTMKVQFGHLTELEQQLASTFSQSKKNTSSIIIGDSSIEEDNAQDLLQAIEEDVKGNAYSLNFFNMNPKPQNASKNGNKHKGQSTFGKSKQLSKEDIGFIGESYAFSKLKDEYDNVKWVSEYALKAGFPEGSDGLGYDFECSKNGETRFIEVKASTSDYLGFTVTKREVEIGEKLHRYYDILYITNVNSKSREFLYLKGIFNYPRNESFFENSKFSVEDDTFKIKFQ